MKPRFKKPLRSSIVAVITAASLTHFAAPVAEAAALTWSGGSGDWQDGISGGWSAAWNSATPDSGSFTGAGGTVTLLGSVTTLSGTAPTTPGLSFAGAGDYTITAGSAQTITVGTGATNAVVRVAAGRTAIIGANVTLQRSAGAGGWYINNGGTLEIATGGAFIQGTTGGTEVAGGSTLRINGGTATLGGSLSIGALTAPGGGANGHLLVDSGSLTIGGSGNLAIGRVNGETTTGTINNGSITVSGGNLNFGTGATSPTATFNLNGGTLTVKAVTSTTNTNSTFNFNGGTLKAATAAAATFMTNVDTARIRNGAAIIDSNGQAITLSQVLAHSNLGGDNAIDGGLTLNDSAVTKGTLTLASANTYTGATKITFGTLSLTNSLALQNSPLDTLNSITGDGSNGLKTALTSLTFGGLTGNKNLADVFTTASGGYSGVTALTLNAGSGLNHSYSGIIANGAAGMTLAKTGSGSQALSGANSYDGLTSISTGSVVLSGSGTLGGTAAGTTVATGTSLALSGAGTFGTGETLTITGLGVTAADHFFAGSVGSRGALQSIGGSNTYAGNIELGTNSTIRIGSQDGASLTLTGAITQATGITSANILFRSGNTAGDYVTLSNAGNSFGGNSAVFAGATAGNYAGLRLGVNNALPTSLTVSGFTGAGAGTAFNLNGFNQSLNGLISGAAGLNIINSDIVSTSTLTLNPTADKTTNNTLIRGGVGLGTINVVKEGSFTQTLSGTHDYTGTTAVNAGALYINGNVSTSNVTVGSTATLGGTGSIGGTVTVNNGGTLSSGASVESLATGALTLNGGSTFDYEMSNDALPGAAGDLTAVTGNLTLDLGNAAILTLSELGTGAWTAGEKLTLISYSGAWNGGLFNYGGTLADDSTFTFSSMQWLFNYNDTTAGTNYVGDLTGSSFVTMTAIPEPRAALLGGLGLLVLLRRRRR